MNILARWPWCVECKLMGESARSKLVCTCYMALCQDCYDSPMHEKCSSEYCYPGWWEEKP